MCVFSKHLNCLHVRELQWVDPGSIQKLILLGDQHLQSISYEFFGQDTVRNCTRKSNHQNKHFNIAGMICCSKCWICKIPSAISYIEGFCCWMNDCCPPLLLRSCCHPSESPHQPQSSPAADSLPVPLAVEYKRREGWRNFLHYTGEKRKLGDRKCDRKRNKVFSMLLKVANNCRGLHSAFNITISSLCDSRRCEPPPFPHFVSHPLLP